MEGIDLSQLARRANNFSGSDLKNLAVYAALESVKDIIPDVCNMKRKRTAKGTTTDLDEESGSPRQFGMQNDESNGGEENVDGHEERDTFELPPRVIRPAHFNSAFEQVTATCLRDMESVQQLRSWAAKFSRNTRFGTESANNGSVRNSTRPTPVNSSYQPYQGMGMSNLDNSVSAYSNAGPTGSTPVGTNASYRSYRGMPNLDTSNALSTYSNVNPIGSIPVGTNVPYRGMSELDNSSTRVNPTGSTPAQTNVSHQPYRGMSNLDDSLSTYSSVNPTGLNPVGTSASHRETSNVDESMSSVRGGKGSAGST